MQERTMECPFEIRALEGRGNGLIALRQILPGEIVVRFACYSYTLFDRDEARGSSDPFNSMSNACCATCIGWTDKAENLPFRCAKCGDGYCSAECQQAAQRRGHGYCCAAIARMRTMDTRKYGRYERGTACFLLRAFARRKADLKRCGAQSADEPVPLAPGEWTVEPSFLDAVSQCQAEESCEGFEKTKAAHTRAIHLAKMQKGSLIDEELAYLLLGGEQRNAFNLWDNSERVRGSINYPQASLFNHSCVPNCAAMVTGDALTFEAITSIEPGQELTYCYLHSFADGPKETIDPWGFEVSDTRRWHAATGFPTATLALRRVRLIRGEGCLLRACSEPAQSHDRGIRFAPLAVRVPAMRRHGEPSRARGL